MTELAADQLLDSKYRVVRLVGQGAWATVYEAINVRIQRRVAIKVLNHEQASQPELAKRFSREAEAATQIDSPFVVAVFDAGTLEDGRPYIVMEFLEGEDLAARLRRVRELSEDEASIFGLHLLTGLVEAHDNGVLHRDIKPENLFLTKARNGEEVLKLVDFGISKPTAAVSPDMLQMTNTDLVLGSPIYMSPEQTRGTRHMDHRSDIYSVGVVLFEAITSELPHDADSFSELMFKVALQDAPDPRTRKPDMDPDLADIIAKSMKRDPELRYQSAVEMRNALVEWLDRRGTLPRSSLTSKIRVRTTPPSDPAVDLIGDGKSTVIHGSVRPSDPKKLAAADATVTIAEERKPDDPKPATKKPADPATAPSALKLTTVVEGAPAAEAAIAQPSTTTARPASGGAARYGYVIGVGLIVVGAVVFFVTRAPKDSSSTTQPTATATATTASATPTATTPATTTAAVATAETTASATTTASTSASASASVAQPTHHPTFRPIATARPTASASAAASSKPVASAQPTATSSSTMVEGRTVRTTF